MCLCFASLCLALEPQLLPLRMKTKSEETKQGKLIKGKGISADLRDSFFWSAVWRDVLFKGCFSLPACLNRRQTPRTFHEPEVPLGVAELKRSSPFLKKKKLIKSGLADVERSSPKTQSYLQRNRYRCGAAAFPARWTPPWCLDKKHQSESKICTGCHVLHRRFLRLPATAPLLSREWCHQKCFSE